MLFLRTFGGLSLESSGLPIVGAAAQRGRLAILAVLAVSGDAVSRDRLLSLFWPESDSERARGALKQALYAVRRDVAERELTLGTSELRLNPEVITSDVREFERALATGNLPAAVALYSGPFLDGIYIKDAPAFEQWVECERQRLGHAFRDALERLATDAHGREDDQTAIGWWRKLAAADPLSARVARAYMEALAAAGDREAAIQHGSVFAERAREEFGAEPESAVLEFVEQLRATSPGVPRKPGNGVRPNHPRHVDRAVEAAPETQVLVDATQPRAANGSAPTPRIRWTVWTPSALVLLLAGAWVSRVALSRPAPLTTARTIQVTTGQTVETEPAVSPDGKLVAFAAARHGETRTGRNRMRIFVKQIGGARAIPITTDSTVDQRTPQWSPDGAQIAFQSPGGIFVVPSLGGAAERVVADDGRQLRMGSWAPDGKRLAFADTQGIWIRDLTRGSERRVVKAGFLPHSPAWSPDGALLVYVIGTGSSRNVAASSIWIVPTSGGTAVRVSDMVRFNTSPVFAPGGRSVLFVSNREGARDIYQQPLRGTRPWGRPARLTTGSNAISISLSVDGRRLVYGALTMRSNIWVAPITLGAATPVSAATPLTSGNQEIESLSVSRDGNWLVYDSNKNGNQDIYKLSLGGGDPIQLTSDAADDFAGEVSPDGREIAFYSFRGAGTRRIYTMLANGSRQEPAADTSGQQWSPAWSPDGSQIAFQSNRPGQRQIYIMRRMATGTWTSPRQLTNLRGGGGGSRWSPDGRYFAWVGGLGLLLVPANGEASRVLVEPQKLGVPQPAFANWGPDPSVLYYRTENHSSQAEFWSIGVGGGVPRLLLRLDDPARMTRRAEFATDGKRIFFTVASDQANVWLVELEK